MNPHFLASAILKDPNITVQPSASDEDSTPNQKLDSFDVLSSDGQVMGYLKSWNDQNGYSGFVHFDADGNVLDWQITSRGTAQ